MMPNLDIVAAALVMILAVLGKGILRFQSRRLSDKI